MAKTYTKFNIDETTLVWGFGIELGFVDCATSTIDQLVAEVNKLSEEQFNKAIMRLIDLW